MALTQYPTEATQKPTERKNTSLRGSLSRNIPLTIKK